MNRLEQLIWDAWTENDADKGEAAARMTLVRPAIDRPDQLERVTEMTTTMTALEQRISRAASQIAGAIYDDASGTVEERIDAALAWRNRGSDGDLTSEDRIALGLLLDALTGVSSDLYDSDTAETIREATEDEAIESALARPEGHILVDGRRCYVAI